MALDFFCPNGHRISCPEVRAGQEAKCPRCGVALRVPNVSGATAQALGNPAAAMPTGAPAVAASEPAGDENLPIGPEEIAFLCPNGHRLQGPARMQGQAGQCPHCGARFLVPVLSDMEQVEEVDLTDLPDEDDLPLQTVDDVPPPSTSRVNPLCKLLQKLWEERERGAVIELHLEGGTIMLPDWFDSKHSRHSHGLFASQAADGTVTMTIVAWSTVLRVLVRNVEGLPEGMFE
jgi:DNA-directed RNA polymerase subunit RPC12/RpoP